MDEAITSNVLRNESSGTQTRSEPHSDDEASSIGDTMGAIGLLTNSAMAEPRIDSGRSAGKLTLLPTILAALSVDGHDPSISIASQTAGRVNPDTRLLPCSLPPRSKSLSYLRAYHSAVSFIPFIGIKCEAEVLNCLDAALAAPRVSQDPNPEAARAAGLSTAGLEPIDVTLVSFARTCELYIEIAVGITVSSDRVRFAHKAQELYTAALHVLPTLVHRSQPLQAVRHLLLLVTFSLFNPAGGSVWHLLGLAIKLCIIAGFHKERKRDPDMPPKVLEDERWLFWSVYTLDRYVGWVQISSSTTTATE